MDFSLKFVMSVFECDCKIWGISDCTLWRVTGPSASPPEKSEESAAAPQPSLSDQLGLEELWNTLGDCLTELAKTPDHHAVLILQPAVEAFFIVHAGQETRIKVLLRLEGRVLKS